MVPKRRSTAMRTQICCTPCRRHQPKRIPHEYRTKCTFRERRIVTEAWQDGTYCTYIIYVCWEHEPGILVSPDKHKKSSS
eukprot:scaffold4510_cov183-Amphora_coffeaeformis.AAC.43